MAATGARKTAFEDATASLKAVLSAVNRQLALALAPQTQVVATAEA